MEERTYVSGKMLRSAAAIVVMVLRLRVINKICLDNGLLESKVW